jgi:uncharacterized membrane protein YdjX (TVP38/TMEM64 family)
MKRTVILILCVAAFVVASKLLIENVLGIDIEPQLRAWMTDAGTGGAVLIAVLLASDIVLPVPSSLVMILSGAAFGVGWGSVIALIGSIGGEWLGFELARGYGRRATRRIVGDEEVERLSGMFARHGAAAVVVTRALPVVMETMSVVAGLSAMKRGTFLTASLVGTVPIVVVYAWAGAASREAGSIIPAAIIAIAVAAFGWVLYRAKVVK